MNFLPSATSVQARFRVITNAPAPFVLIVQSDGAVAARWLIGGSASRELRDMREDATILDSLAQRMEAYFAGERVDFSDVPLPADGGPFTRRCREVCRAIPPGRTISYAELAKRAGSPGAARAAGQAMRTNPLPVIVPCHRIVDSAGRLHGYAGHTNDRSQALAVKRRLLELECLGARG